MSSSRTTDDFEDSGDDRPVRELPAHRRQAVYAEVDYFITLISRRYGINPQDVVETVRWVKEKKQTADRLKMSGAVALIGVVVTALMLAIWEGMANVLRRGG